MSLKVALERIREAQKSNATGLDWSQYVSSSYAL